MKHLTGMSAVLTLALALSACGSSPSPTPLPATIEASGAVTASATVGGTTSATLGFKNGGGTDLGYTASASYPSGKASGWLTLKLAEASGTVKAGESKTVTVSATCPPFVAQYAATVTLLSKDGKLSKTVPITLNCAAEASLPENAPVLSVRSAETTVSGGTAHIIGTASDNVQVQRVTYRLGGGEETSVAGLTGAKSVDLDFTVSGLGAGHNQITVTAYDTSGNATPRTLAVTYNAPAPDPEPVPVDLSAPVLTVPGDQLTREESLTLSGSVSDEGGSGLGAVTYTVSRDGGTGESMSAVLDGSAYRIGLADLTDGVYTVTITAEDHAGNRSTAQTVKVTVDQTAPTIGAGDVSVTDRLDGTAAVRVSMPDAAELWYSLDGTIYTRAAGSSPFAFTLPAKGSLTAGSQTVWLKAVDTAGNKGQPMPYGFTLAPYGDLTAPRLSVPGPQLTREGQIHLTGTVSDEGGVASVRYTVGMDGGAPGEAAEALLSGTEFSLDLTGLTDGMYTVHITARDHVGNEESARTMVTVDQTAPIVTPGDLTVTDNHDGTAAVGVAGSEVGTVWYSLDGVTYVQAVGASIALPGPFPAGTFPLWVRVVDAAGNASTPVQTNVVIAPYGDLTAPALTLDAVNPNRTGHVSVTGLMTDQSSVSAAYTLSGPTPRTGDLVPGAGGALTLDLDGLEEGRYTLIVDAQDAAGNTSREQISFLVDKTGPVASSDVEPTTWRNTDLTAHFTASDGLSGLADDADASFDLTVTGEAASPTQPAQVTRVLRDRARNETTVTASAWIDRSAPTVTAVPGRAPEWNGWYGGNVTVTFACEDALSGVAACPDPQVLGASGTAGAGVQDRAGNEASASLDLKIDKSGPAFGVDLTGTLVGVDGGYDGKVTGTLTDETSIESVTASVNGAAPVPVTFTPGASVALSLDVLALQDGPNVIVLTATDVFGHQSQKTVTITAPDLSAPTLVSLSYELVNPGTTSTTLRLYGRATDLVGVTSVNYSLNGSVEQPLALTGLSVDVTFDSMVSGLVSGTNTMTVRAVDAAGNVETQVQTFNISATDYIAPSISNLTAIYKGNSRNIGVTATITDTAPIGGMSGIASVVLQYTLNGQTVTKNIMSNLSGTALSYKLTNVPVGTEVTLIVTDTSGNMNSATTKIIRR